MKPLAIAEFGSVCRRTADDHSDRDLLVVCSFGNRARLSKHYAQNGYSVCSLTPAQLLYMQQRGSLFIQHLRMEARILVDLESKFSKWLNTCELRPPSAEELDRCRSTVEFLSEWPEDSRLEGWRADFLYCISRDLLIKWLASHRILAFGLDDIDRGVGQVSDELLGHFANLALLRQAKAAYRAGDPLPENTSDAIRAWTKAIESFLRCSRAHPRKLPLEDFIQALATHTFSSNYERLRSLEAVRAIGCWRGIHHPDNEQLQKHITRPNEYGSSQARKAQLVSSYLVELLNLLAKEPFNSPAHPLCFRATG